MGREKKPESLEKIHADMGRRGRLRADVRRTCRFHTDSEPHWESTIFLINVTTNKTTLSEMTSLEALVFLVSGQLSSSWWEDQALAGIRALLLAHCSQQEGKENVQRKTCSQKPPLPFQSWR